jgi:hypothetical protein
MEAPVRLGRAMLAVLVQERLATLRAVVVVDRARQVLTEFLGNAALVVLVRKHPFQDRQHTIPVAAVRVLQTQARLDRAAMGVVAMAHLLAVLL